MSVTSSDILEGHIEKCVCDWAKKNGWLTRKLCWQGRASAPDRFYVKGGRVVLIEFKRRGRKPTELQKREIASLRGAGVEVWVVDNIDDGIRILTYKPNFFPWLADYI